VSRYWAVNASPLIVLAKIGRVDLLAALCDVLVIPAGTTEEVLRGDEQDPAARWIRDEGHRFIVQDAPSTPEVSAWDLGQGETAVLSWVHQHPGYEALLDDRAARNCAAALGIPVRGTLGILLLAKKDGLIEQVAPVMQAVIAAGLQVHPNLHTDVLRLAGESR
jgi:predicted nucleic acid-binding protein